MTEREDAGTSDLSGTADERIAQLASLEQSTARLTSEWLRRQLRSALGAWAEDETKVDIEAESRTDY